MAKELNSVNKSTRPLIICVALVCLFQQCMAEISISARIMGGNEAFREEWPFIAALYLNNRSQYFCGGTLISDKQVLTAAHCIHGKGSDRKLSADDIEVRLGAYNLTAKWEEGVVLRNVTNIYIHSDWDVYDDRYDADLAILVLNDKVIFTTTITPISFPADGVVFDGDRINNINGTIVGWGFATNKIHEEIPKQAAIRAFSNSHCFLTYDGIASISSARTFCAGSEDGSPSEGDSGGGFFVDTGTEWVQYGIISSCRTNEIGHVVRDSVSVYTKIKLFKNWIMKIIEESKSSANQILHCSYYEMYSSYECFLHDLDIRTENIDVSSFTGTHDNGKTDKDVTDISFHNGSMFFLPNGVGKYFKTLRSLGGRGLNTKRIMRSNLQNLENLRALYFDNNEIELLQFDTLWDLPALEGFSLDDNKLKVLDERTFEKNEKLKLVFLQSNRLEFLPRNIFKTNHLLEEIKLNRNALKNIETDLSTLKNIKLILLVHNVCINAFYANTTDLYLTSSYNRPIEFRDMSAFHRQIMADCSTTNELQNTSIISVSK